MEMGYRISTLAEQKAREASCICKMWQEASLKKPKRPLNSLKSSKTLLFCFLIVIKMEILTCSSAPEVIMHFLIQGKFRSGYLKMMGKEILKLIPTHFLSMRQIYR